VRLDILSGLPGVRSCALVGEDGLPLEMQGELGEALAAELAALRAGTERVGRRLGLGQVTRLAFTSDLVEVVAVFAGDFAVGVALLRGTDTRTAQQALARIAVTLAAPGQGLPTRTAQEGV
jgi:predicted regulator of Ras-like GTPase activity (Roadblock/LC7/MglB family)